MSAFVIAEGLALPGRLQATSLGLERGQLVCLIGPNGSGKTSLLHALAGIGSPQGRVLIGGLDPWRLGPAQRQRLFSYLPAMRDIKWPLRAADLIALGLPPGVDLGEVLRALALEPLLDRRVDRLSTGERARLLIARALAAGPELLLLDEPMANLDPLWQIRLAEHLRDLCLRGRTVLMAVHDLETARRHANRLIVMMEGRVKADGEPRGLLEGPGMAAVFGVSWAGGEWRPAS